MQRHTLAALLAGCFALSAKAQDIPALEEIVVTATRIATPDVSAPYASEVHTRPMIEASGATTLYDYLAQFTSVHVSPSYGNRYTPKLDMRGYGQGDGYQNIVVTLDGRRLGNIDQVPPLLGAIPLADVERIEITKGSGGVMFGDGAMAGSIQIYTRAHDGVGLQASVGNHGALAGTATAGMQKEGLRLSATADYASLDGYSARDPSGHTDASSNRTWRGGLAFRPIDRLEFALDAASSRIDTRYPSPLTLAQFRTDPAQAGGTPYNHQRLDSDTWGLGVTADLAAGLKLTARHTREDKLSDYGPSWRPGYDYASDDIGLAYTAGALDLQAGWQSFDGARATSSDRTSKDNRGMYLQGQYRLARTTFSLGGRHETVKYRYAPTAGAALQAEHGLDAWEAGVNHRLDEGLSLFAHVNRAYQAPDIDRFFTSGGGFNGFIQPALSRTVDVGLNHVTPTQRLKLTLFHTRLQHEIYYNTLTFTNTNLDRTHKYGLELQDNWRATDALAVSLNYTYTRAIIDRENDGGGAYNGKDLPGVPRHGVILGLHWQATQNTSLGLTHTWRGQAYAAEDFANAFSQRQAAYQSTQLGLRQRLKDLEWFATIDNLFAHRNGVWIRDDAIYPVDFTRNWRLGVKASF
jgi:iron complex outermembrane receptor protein